MKNILILGGGYGGLKCATTLQKKLENEDVSVELISKHDYHYPTTLLHKIAVGTYSARKARIFYRHLLKRKNFSFFKDTITKIDIKNRQISGELACYKYDYLVISLGFEPNDFNLKGVNEYAFKLSTLNEALRLRHHIETKFKDYRYHMDEKDLVFVVCGSGFTGVEFAAELANHAKNLCEMCGIDKKLVKIHLIGRSEHILPMFRADLSQIAKEKLEKLGVNVVAGNVIECQKDGVVIENADKSTYEIKANTVLWTAGVKGSSVIKDSNLETRASRIEVNEFLQLPGYEDVFVLGDCAIANDRDIIHAPTAQLASQMGEYCGLNLIKLVNGEELKTKFKFKHRGTVCSIGHTDAIGMAFGKGITGEPAAFLKNFIENKWIFGVAGFWNVLKKGQFRFRSSY
ncbi:NAD(P)/FAD-dependent oxidoreductase [Campylobacter geochelonis]|uniref:NADH dehydrogenase ndh n=1 Tax=Campylobacter geochelonis TaxID=1780362 RepID=A0A128EKM0_9BACT|nr:NAD(P)/FAD-dependent oxidoreductase [Campylobacter geochelonis]QKF71708.1 NADH dehydrogenase [Campylobacter geochelonis]CZE49479.1 NADH dehydrogenase ndh [Campylobacter geochelonis]